MKITVVGAGSTYTPELVEGFLIEAQTLGLRQVCLYDISESRLEIVGGLAQRMAKAKGNPFEVILTTNRREAITGSSFVLTQIRVGGQRARHEDTLICLEEDVIGQETTGPAGFAKALRTIPAMLDICQDIRKYAPNAWVINFTNPAGIVTEALLKYGGVKVIGLCNVPIGIKMNIAKRYGVSHDEVDLDYVGLNHLSWVRRIWVRGEEKTEEVLTETKTRMANIPDLGLDEEFLQALKMLPSSYLRYFYLSSEMLSHLQAKETTRAQEVSEIEEVLLEKYKCPELKEKPKELEKRGGAHYSLVALSLARDIHTNKGAKHIVNVANNGVIPSLPKESVVEVTAMVDARGALPIALDDLQPEIRGLVQHVNAYEGLTVEAAVKKDYGMALLALVNNPLVNSVQKAKRLLDRFNQLHDLQLS